MIEMLQLIWQKRKFIAAFTAGVFVFIYLCLMILPKTYQATSVVRIFQFMDPTSGINLTMPMLEKMSLLETHKCMLISREVLERVIARLPWLMDNDKPIQTEAGSLIPDRVIDRIRGMITMETVKFTDLLVINVRYKEKKPVALIANTLVDAYRDWLAIENSQAYGSMTDFLNQRISMAKKKLEESEDSLYRYGKKTSVVFWEGEIKQKLEMTGKLELAISELGAKKEYYKDLSKQVEQDPQGVASMAGFAENSRIQGLVKNYDQVNLEIVLTQKYYKPSHPKYMQLVAKKNMLRQDLVEQLKASYQSAILSLEVSREKSNTELNLIREQLYRLRDKNQGLERLKRELKTNEEIYLALLEKYEASELLKARKSLVDVLLISSAVEPEKPVLPRRKKTIVLGTGFGFMMAVAIALLSARKKQILKALKLG